MTRYLMGAVLFLQMSTSVVLADDEGEEPVAEQEPTVQIAPPLNPGVEALLDCISWAESRDTPSAYNPKSGAAGQFQFTYPTWMETPQGRAGMSRYDPVAARSAARWMIGQGLKRRWTVVQIGLC